MTKKVRIEHVLDLVEILDRIKQDEKDKGTYEEGADLNDQFYTDLYCLIPTSDGRFAFREHLTVLILDGNFDRVHQSFEVLDMSLNVSPGHERIRREMLKNQT